MQESGATAASRGKIGAYDLGRDQVLRVGMRRGGGIGIPQDCWPKAGFEIDRISLVAFQCAVEVEGATRPGTCHNRDSWALAIRTLGGTSGDRGVIRICTEAG